MAHSAIYKRFIILAHCPKGEYFQMLHEESMMPYIYSTFISDISQHTQHICRHHNHAICITKIILLPIVVNNQYYAKVKL